MKQTGLLDVLKAQERVTSELSKEILRLRAENDKLRAEQLNTRELLNMALNGDAPICPVCGEPMTRRNDDGTLGCNLCYAEGR